MLQTLRLWYLQREKPHAQSQYLQALHMLRLHHWDFQDQKKARASAQSGSVVPGTDHLLPVQVKRLQAGVP